MKSNRLKWLNNRSGYYDKVKQEVLKLYSFDENVDKQKAIEFVNVINRELARKNVFPLRNFTFIDLFAGCGGLSLGLMQAGWKGLLAIEKSPDAFNTLWRNLGYHEESANKGNVHEDFKYRWPAGFGRARAHQIEIFLKKYEAKLKDLDVDLLAGGPPCQGFSSAGRRLHGDKRNRLYRQYLKFVELVKPKLLLFENVKGISMPFTSSGNQKVPDETYAALIKKDIDACGYEAKWFDVQASMFGVPQRRSRYILLGVNREVFSNDKSSHILEEFGRGLTCRERRKAFIVEELGLPASNIDEPVSVRQAIGDLSSEKNLPPEKYDPTECDFAPGEYNGPFKDYKQLSYNYNLIGPPVRYQRLMREGLNGQKVNSRRLARHSGDVSKKFSVIHEFAKKGTIKKGRNLTESEKRAISTSLGMGKELKKHAMVILHENRPAHTLTTLPDDLLHYCEPRILTVREYARLQSFPDWFEFKGKYTTGGGRRTQECPRYTQVGNAVPPLLSRYIGKLLKDIAPK